VIRSVIALTFVSVCVLFAGASPQKIAPTPATSLPRCGPLIQLVLSCPLLGFTYKVPFGWVDRTDDMNQRITSDTPHDPPSANPEGSRQTSSNTTSKTLLAVFERPPETQGDTINSAVIIAIEERSLYPQIKTAADYFGPLSEIAAERGLKMDGDPYWFAVGGKRVARADFTSGGEKSSAQQTSLVLLEKSYILSFTFLAGSGDEIDSLAANLTFTAGVRKPRSKSGTPDKSR
jgi:hypothetical protein